MFLIQYVLYHLGYYIYYNLIRSTKSAQSKKGESCYFTFFFRKFSNFCAQMVMS